MSPTSMTLKNSFAAYGFALVALMILFNSTIFAQTSNPIDDPVFFVSQQYRDFFSREPDAAGLDFWVKQIAACGNDQACIVRQRSNTSGAFFLSIEFQNMHYLVYRLYVASYGQQPRYADFLPDTQAIGRGVIVCKDCWDNLLQ